MSDDRPKKPDATIQLDQLDAEQIALVDSEPAIRHATPPPLPPEELLRASAAPPAGSHAPPGSQKMGPSTPAPRSMGKTVGLVAVFVVLIAVAIVGGLHVGGLARGTAPSASLSVAVAPTPSPKPTPSASASAPVNEITIPTIEMR